MDGTTRSGSNNDNRTARRGGHDDPARRLGGALEPEPVTRALGDGIEELLELIELWGAAIRATKGYPDSGPHELAARAAI